MRQREKPMFVRDVMETSFKLCFIREWEGCVEKFRKSPSCDNSAGLSNCCFRANKGYVWPRIERPPGP